MSCFQPCLKIYIQKWKEYRFFLRHKAEFYNATCMDFLIKFSTLINLNFPIHSKLKYSSWSFNQQLICLSPYINKLKGICHRLHYCKEENQCSDSDNNIEIYLFFHSVEVPQYSKATNVLLHNIIMH